MFEFINDPEERGQVGIGTLIVFIAMVLVAAIAAGVLINTAGFLQSKSEATGQESSAQVSNRVSVISAYGNVNDAADNVTDGTVEYVNLTVMRSAGADNINLSRSTIEWIGPNRAATLVHGGNTSSAATNDAFATKNIKGGSDVVLNDQEARIQVVLNAVKVRNNVATLDTEYAGLGEGDEVKLKITTQYGATTNYYVNVPESLDDKSAVQV